jgi:glutathione S-transferase
MSRGEKTPERSFLPRHQNLCGTARPALGASIAPSVVSRHRRFMIRFVSVDEARAARGLRLVVLGGVPSYWSEAAKGMFQVKKIPFVAVRFALNDPTVVEWTGVRNAPVAVYDDEPPRSGWADLLALAERLDRERTDGQPPGPPLLPEAEADRVTTLGIVHEIAAEDGMSWSVRLQMIHASLSTGGAKGFSFPISQHLAGRYGYDVSRVARAETRMTAVLEDLRERLRASAAAGSPYLVGDRLTAADIYCATALAALAPLPEADCPMPARVRKAFESMFGEAPVPPELLAHRRLVYERHLSLPVEL